MMNEDQINKLMENPGLIEQLNNLKVTEVHMDDSTIHDRCNFK